MCLKFPQTSGSSLRVFELETFWAPSSWLNNSGRLERWLRQWSARSLPQKTWVGSPLGLLSRDGCLNQRVRDRGKFICNPNRIQWSGCPGNARWGQPTYISISSCVLGHLIISSAWLRTIRAWNRVLSPGPMASNSCQRQADSPLFWQKTNHFSSRSLSPYLRLWPCCDPASFPEEIRVLVGKLDLRPLNSPLLAGREVSPSHLRATLQSRGNTLPQKSTPRTSLAIQCLRLCTCTAGGTGFHPWSGN